MPEGTDKEGRTIVARGAWGEWLQEIDVNDRVAQQFIKIHTELALDKPRTSSFNLGMQALYEIATMPEEHRDLEHEIPTTGEVKKVEDMTVRELREVKKALKDAEKTAQQAESARRQAELDPIKKSRIADFMREYWIAKGEYLEGRPKKSGQNVHTFSDVAKTIGESEKTTQRLLKLNELIPQLQRLVSSGKLGTTSAEQLAYLTPEVQTALYDALGEEIGERTVAQTKQIRLVANLANTELIEETFDCAPCAQTDSGVR